MKTVRIKRRPGGRWGAVKATPMPDLMKFVEISRSYAIRPGELYFIPDCKAFETDTEFLRRCAVIKNIG